MQKQQQFWAVIPAAGVGKRMGSDVPKQYLPLHGKTVIEHTLDRFLDHPAIAGVVVAISAGDEYWAELGLSMPHLHVVTGGTERCHSVLNALDYLEGIAKATDWVLVHDAARPCLRDTDVQQLIDTLAEHAVGGLLGLPVSDTVKRTDASGRVETTVPRDNLWRALTPQMFRLGDLRQALSAALEQGVLVTDDASAMEFVGKAPLMVEGHADNIKITRPQDLPLAELYLHQQESD